MLNFNSIIINHGIGSKIGFRKKVSENILLFYNLHKVLLVIINLILHK